MFHGLDENILKLAFYVAYKRKSVKQIKNFPWNQLSILIDISVENHAYFHEKRKLREINFPIKILDLNWFHEKTSVFTFSRFFPPHFYSANSCVIKMQNGQSWSSSINQLFDFSYSFVVFNPLRIGDLVDHSSIVHNLLNRNGSYSWNSVRHSENSFEKLANYFVNRKHKQ